VVYDFDDALWVRSARHADNRSTTREKRFRRMISSADQVVAGNSFLAEKASAYNRRVSVIPSPIDVSLYQVRPEGAGGDSVVVGWIGAHGSVHYLEKLLPALEEAHRRDPRLRLKVVSSRFPDSGSLPVDRVSWRADTELEEIRSMDVGVMPLFEDEWSRGKCGLKVLQYLAAGVPVVVTPAGINSDIVKDGVEGFWARSPAEWVDRILALAADPALRRRMGLAGRKTVEAGYSLEVCLRRLEAVLKK
jgi:glycosyltransferase involved in cell wall biosynthesis